MPEQLAIKCSNHTCRIGYVSEAKVTQERFPCSPSHRKLRKMKRTGKSVTLDIMYSSILLLLFFIFSIACYLSEIDAWIPLIALLFLSLSYSAMASVSLFKTSPDDKTYIRLIPFLPMFFIPYALSSLYSSEFLLWIGDAGAYVLDGISRISGQPDEGHFLPLASSITALGYAVFGYSLKSYFSSIIFLFALTPLTLIINRIGVSKGYALVFAALYFSTPLTLWFSKTTFSEVTWQLIIICSIFFVVFSEDAKGRFNNKLSICLVGLLITTAIFSRVTGVLLAISLLAAVSMAEVKNTNIRQKVVPIIVINFAFALAFALIVYLRPTYMVEWQFSKLIALATPFIVTVQLVFSVLFVSLLGISVLPLGRRLFANDGSFRVCIVIFLVLIKVAGAYFLVKDNLSWEASLLSEFNFARYSLGSVYLSLIAVGIGLCLKRTVEGSLFFTYLLLLYVGFSLPFSLHSVTPQMPHEMYLYWFRYYFSELHLIHFIFAACGFYVLLGLFSAKREALLATVVLALLFSQKMDMKHSVITQPYLAGSSGAVEKMVAHLNDQPVHLIYNDKVKYSNLDFEHLFKFLGKSNIEFVSKHVVSNTEQSKKLLKSYLHSTVLTEDAKVLCVSNRPADCEVATASPETTECVVLPYMQHKSNEDFRETDFRFCYSTYLVEPYSSLLTSGWYARESWGVWSSASASFTIAAGVLRRNCDAVKACHIKILAHVFAASNEAAKTLILSQNGISSSTVIFKSPTARSLQIDVVGFQKLIDQGQNLVLDFKVDGAVSPSSVGKGSDERVLGLGFFDLDVSAEI